LTIQSGRKTVKGRVVSRKRGKTVVRTKEAHPHKPSKKQEQKLIESKIREEVLWDKRWNRTITEQERKELRGIFRLQMELGVPRNIVMTKLRAVNQKDIVVKERKKPTRQQVPKTQRRKTRQQALIQQTARRWGRNPKRMRRTLARKGIRVKRI